MPSLALLWHLHQPEYRDPRTGRPTMPWTRLHALRGYRDLFVESAEEQWAVTLNIVPGLLDQLLYYAHGGVDEHLELTRRPAEALEAHELSVIHQTFVCGNARMRANFPGYLSLISRVESGNRLSVADVRDLQVWSTLAWFGATATRDLPAIAALRAKGSGFSEQDKQEMLDAQRSVLEELPLLLRRVAQTDGPSISTTPYYHPILPLLVDARHAKRCLPDLPDEVSFAWPEDAQVQLVRARARMAEVIGEAPVGLWPSEGAVSPEILPLVAAAGFQWLATDEGILHRSDRVPARRGPGPWDLGQGLTGFFRDHDLSDRIGFRYATMAPDAAAVDLVQAVAQRAGDGDVVLVALDGENPWEAFPDAGGAFRRALRGLMRTGPVRAITLDEACRAPRAGQVRKLFTGSWINADLAIWIGHADDRAAWRLLSQVRAAVAGVPDGPARRAAMEHVHAAEASDWFWWYGDEFSTPFASKFDALFRAHLRAALEAVSQPVPDALLRPVAVHLTGRSRPPWRWISPGKDGFSEEGWRPAGRVDFGDGGAMARTARFAKGFSYGWSRDGALWVRVDVLATALPREAQWEIKVDDRAVRVAALDGAQAREGTLSVRVVGNELLIKHVPARGGPDAATITLGVSWPEDAAEWEPMRLIPPEAPARTWWVA